MSVSNAENPLITGVKIATRSIHRVLIRPGTYHLMLINNAINRGLTVGKEEENATYSLQTIKTVVPGILYAIVVLADKNPTTLPEAVLAGLAVAGAVDLTLMGLTSLGIRSQHKKT